MDEHLGYEKRAVAGSGMSRNGCRANTLLTDNAGRVEIAVAARAAFEEFEAQWASRYPAISGLWRSAWEQFTLRQSAA